MKNNIDIDAKKKWDAIFKSLEKWLMELRKNENANPAVNAVADHYQDENLLSKDDSFLLKDDSLPSKDDAHISTDDHHPWIVLVSTIISLRTKDDVTVAASKRLLDKADNPTKLSKLKEETIASLIYPAGFYRTKASSLKKIAAIILDQYNGKVPPEMEKLLLLPGVGRKTANLVLSEGFNIDAICVDIHVHRISNRAGWLTSKTPEETETILRQILPVKYWKRINYLLVLYGQNICRPISPYCSRCVIEKYCTKSGVEKTR